MSANAVRLIQKMSGGAQAHLIEADNGRFYVVKFRHNPQGRRILVNDWIGSTVLRHLGIACPEPVLIRISREFLKAYPDVGVRDRAGTIIPPDPGLHFGSTYPGDPKRIAIFDFLPDWLLSRVANVNEFAATLVADKWMDNADSRQAVFLRGRVAKYAPSVGGHPLRKGFVALMIDHGHILSGPAWKWCNAPSAGLYVQPFVYHRLRRWSDLEPWIGRVETFPEAVISGSVRQIPREWLEGDVSVLESLVDQLLRRRRRVIELIRGCIDYQPDRFPLWQRDSVIMPGVSPRKKAAIKRVRSTMGDIQLFDNQPYV